jgi:hypothetical protein
MTEKYYTFYVYCTFKMQYTFTQDEVEPDFDAGNNDGQFGHWTYHLVMHPGDLGKVLDQQPAMAKLKAA